jgi:hypothetical protein
MIELNPPKNLAARRCAGDFAILFILTSLTVMLFGARAEAIDRQVLRGHVPSAVAKMNLQPIGPLTATNRLRLAIGLPLRNTNTLSKLLKDMYDPASPRFRHYLTLEQFTEQFGPAQEDYESPALTPELRARFTR